MKTLRNVIAGMAIASLPLVAQADSPHFVKGPTVSCSGATLVVSFKVAGLGDVTEVQGTLTGDAAAQCINGGGNPPPGQSGPFTVEADFPVRNGSTSGSLRSSPTLKCPDHMTVEATYTNLVLTVDGLTQSLGSITCP